jgi:hypothetical protein
VFFLPYKNALFCDILISKKNLYIILQTSIAEKQELRQANWFVFSSRDKSICFRLIYLEDFSSMYFRIDLEIDLIY